MSVCLVIKAHEQSGSSLDPVIIRHSSRLQINGHHEWRPTTSTGPHRVVVAGTGVHICTHTHTHTHTHQNINNYWMYWHKVDSWIQKRRLCNTGMYVRLCTHSWRPSCGSPQVWSGWRAWGRLAAWALPLPDRKLSYPSPPPPDTAHEWTLHPGGEKGKNKRSSAKQRHWGRARSGLQCKNLTGK